MGGDEDHDGRVVGLAHQGSGLHSGQPGHLDVEEDDVGPRRPSERDRLGRARRLAGDLHLGVPREQVAELGARRRLVVDEQGADRHASSSETGTSSRTTVPNGNERSFIPSP